MYQLPKLDQLLSVEDFEPWLGAVFTLDADPDPVSIQLIKIAPRMTTSLSHRKVAFSLIFRSQPDVMLLDGIYAMTSGRFGPVNVHITPVMSPPGERHYEAVFT